MDNPDTMKYLDNIEHYEILGQSWTLWNIGTIWNLNQKWIQNNQECTIKSKGIQKFSCHKFSYNENTYT